MEEDNFSQQDSLKLINEMIGKAKKSYVTKGIAPIMWGSIIFICSLATWVEIHFKINLGDVWLLTIIAIIPQVYFGFKENKKRGFTSYEGDTLTAVWIAFSVSIFITSFYFGTHNVSGDSSSLFMMLYAIPTFITGSITKFKPMIFGGIFCWFASIISMFTPLEADFILMAACGLFAWLIPGIILWGRYKKGKCANV
jgi:hypothetical protein